VVTKQLHYASSAVSAWNVGDDIELDDEWEEEWDDECGERDRVGSSSSDDLLFATLRRKGMSQSTSVTEQRSLGSSTSIFSKS
jgi:hypothetical protein